MILALAILVILISCAPVEAVTLSWAPVTENQSDHTLAPDEAITKYNIYRCRAGADCVTKEEADLIGSVPGNVTEFDIKTQPLPGKFVVDAENAFGISPSSDPLAVIEVKAPKKPADLKVK